MKNESLESFDVGALKVRIFQDTDPQSPREDWNLGTLFTAHRNYALGDRDSVESVEEAVEIAASKDYLSLPVFMLDHSGLCVRTGDFNDVDPGELDSGQVGIIYVSKEEVLKEYSWKRLTKVREALIRKYLDAEIETLNQYLTGDVYGYVIEGPDGEEIDSCWGFYGMEYCRAEGQAVAESIHKNAKTMAVHIPWAGSSALDFDALEC